MPASVSLKALGLETQPNQLDLPPGSLTAASNVIIQRDNVIQQRRGFKLYGNSLGSSSDTAKQLFDYQGRILRHFNSTLQFDSGLVDSTGTAIFESFFGSILEAQPGLRIKSIEANGNLYLTTSTGIQKLSAFTAADFTTNPGFITQAGGIQAIDFTARLHIVPGEQNGWFTQDSAVAYRIVWGTTDANNNLILGAPSGSVVIYNPLLGLLIPDYMRVLGALDDINQSGSLITDGNYVSLLSVPASDSGVILTNNLIALAAKIDNDILYADTVSAPLQLATPNAITISGTVATVTFTSGVPTNYFTIGSPIYLNGFTPATGTVNGGQIVTFVNSTTIKFNTTATGPVSQASPTIVSNIFRSITPVPSPMILPATDGELVALQTYLSSIITALQALPNSVISTTLLNEFILPLDITTTATVILHINIPQGITTNDFFQIYRSNLEIATGAAVLAELTPNDELQLVYEAFPTAAQIAAGFVEVEDIVLDSFKGANLYTNAQSGEGILQANNAPPFALDINAFKGYIFFANTRTLQNTNLSLLGISNFKAGNITSISASNPTTITTDTPHLLSTGDMVYINGTNSTPMISGIFSVTVTGANTFTIPVNVTVAGTTGYWTNSLLSITDGTTTNIYKFIKGTFESTVVTTRAANDAVYSPGTLGGKYFTINSANNVTKYYVWYNTGSSIDPAPPGLTPIEVVITATDSAANVARKTATTVATVVADFNTSFLSNTVTITNTTVGYTNDATVATSQFSLAITRGIGANAANNEVLLSTLVSPAQQIDQTTRSLINAINLNSSEIVYGYYLSGPADVPGKFVLTGRILTNTPFYVMSNNSIVGTSFSPNLSPTITNITNTAANPTVVTAVGHGFVSGDQVLIEFSNSTPSINGLWTVKVIDANHFSIPVNVTVAGTTGAIIKSSLAQNSTNDVKANRIYYSKFQQPDAVPATNFIDIGAENKAILRIFPLRDSLFVFKEDGLWRLSGEIAPFSVSLFDGSAILLAPDSIGLANNLVYGWTIQGIQIVTESGVSLISRPIDVDILKLASSNYPNFTTATWGVGYISDNSYYVWTVNQTTDTVATIGYRYSNLTNSWTTIDKTNTCGIVASFNDKLYLGAGDTNFIEQERKTFDRTDYADREFTSNLAAGAYLNGGITFILPDVSNIAAGDVITQTQLLTVYTYNTLLEKLNLDPGVGLVNISSMSLGSTITITTSLPHNLSNGDFALISNTTSKPVIDGLYKITYISTTSFSITVPMPVLVAGVGNVKYSFYDNLKSFAADDLRTKLTQLTGKLDTDPILLDPTYTSSIAAIGPLTITNISTDNPTQITVPSHGLISGRYIEIVGSNSVPSIDGNYVVTVIDANTFSVATTVQVAGNAGTINTLNEDFIDVQNCYNIIIDKLILAPTTFKNYILSTGTTLQEVIVTSVRQPINQLNVALALDFVVGPLTVYKAITSTYSYAPITMGDTLSLKHMRESTLMFNDKQFTTAVLSFASDLIPSFTNISFHGDGNGIFGFTPFGENYFGGTSHGAPFRTYIPRNNQRCRYLIAQFTHSTAREKYAIYGLSVVGEVISTRAYR